MSSQTSSITVITSEAKQLYHTMNQAITNLVETGIIAAALAVAWLAIYQFIIKKRESLKARQRLKIRLFYFFIFAFILFAAKIWITGFIHILTLLSLVSAALVVVNKELMMNIEGWLIINWRGLFTEGDYVYIQHYSGFVYELGVLYFKILESSQTSPTHSSGRMIKIPNGLVINNPVINYSQYTNLLEYQLYWLVAPTSDIESVKKVLLDTAQQILDDYYQGSKQATLERIKRRSKLISKTVDFSVRLTTEIEPKKPAGIKLTLSYYCFPKDSDIIKEKLIMGIYQVIIKEKKIALVYEGRS